MKKSSTYKRDIVNYLGIVAIVIVLNYILSFMFGRFDMTEDDRYSLSDSTKEMLQDDERFSERIYFRIYLDGDLPADFRRIRNSIQEKLDEFIVYAGDKIQYEFIDPNADEDEEFNIQVQRGLQEDGLTHTVVNVMEKNSFEKQIIWPGALIEYQGSTVDYIQFLSKAVVYEGEDTRGLADGVIN